MSNRIIKESICTSESLNNLTWFQQSFFFRLIVNADDYGRVDARLKILKANCFPLNDDIGTLEIQEGIQALHTAGQIDFYAVAGRPYIQIINWEEHQRIRNKKSMYPAPEKGKNTDLLSIDRNSLTIDSELLTIAVNCQPNPIQSNQNPIQSESNHLDTIPVSIPTAQTPFDTFWELYPRKVNKPKTIRAFQDAMIYTGGNLPVILDGVKEWTVKRWDRGDKQFFPGSWKFLMERKWEEHPLDYVETPKRGNRERKEIPDYMLHDGLEKR